MAPNFLLSPMGSTNFMRLSLKKGADVDLSCAACRKFGVFVPASAGALHGLNKMGRSPFRCYLSRTANPKKENNPSPGESNHAKPTCPGVPGERSGEICGFLLPLRRLVTPH
jgi:hypothetical protein